MMMLTEVLPIVKQLSALEKLRLIRFLAEDLDAAEDISPFEPGKVYDIPSPYDSFGAAKMLMEFLEKDNESGEGACVTVTEH